MGQTQKCPWGMGGFRSRPRAAWTQEQQLSAGQTGRESCVARAPPRNGAPSDHGRGSDKCPVMGTQMKNYNMPRTPSAQSHSLRTRVRGQAVYKFGVVWYPRERDGNRQVRTRPLCKRKQKTGESTNRSRGGDPPQQAGPHRRLGTPHRTPAKAGNHPQEVGTPTGGEDPPPHRRQDSTGG